MNLSRRTVRHALAIPEILTIRAGLAKTVLPDLTRRAGIRLAEPVVENRSERAPANASGKFDQSRRTVLRRYALPIEEDVTGRAHALTVGKFHQTGRAADRLTLASEEVGSRRAADRRLTALPLLVDIIARRTIIVEALSIHIIRAGRACRCNKTLPV